MHGTGLLCLEQHNLPESNTRGRHKQLSQPTDSRTVVQLDSRTTQKYDLGTGQWQSVLTAVCQQDILPKGFFSRDSVISSRSTNVKVSDHLAPQSHQSTNAGVPGRYVPPRDVDLFTQRARSGYSLFSVNVTPNVASRVTVRVILLLTMLTRE